MYQNLKPKEKKGQNWFKEKYKKAKDTEQLRWERFRRRRTQVARQ